MNYYIHKGAFFKDITVNPLILTRINFHLNLQFCDLPRSPVLIMANQPRFLIRHQNPVVYLPPPQCSAERTPGYSNSIRQEICTSANTVENSELPVLVEEDNNASQQDADFGIFCEIGQQNLQNISPRS